MPDDTNSDDVTRDPETGRITIQKAGTYRISAPLVNAEPTTTTEGVITRKTVDAFYADLAAKRTEATWVGGPKDGQPVTPEEIELMTSEQRLRDYTAAVARLRADPDTWAAYQRERKELDGTAWAQERIVALEAALHALVDDEYQPAYWDDDGDPRCCYCHSPGSLLHVEDCPVARARALLKGPA